MQRHRTTNTARRHWALVPLLIGGVVSVSFVAQTAAKTTPGAARDTAADATTAAYTPAPAAVLFSPKGGCTDAVVKAIGAAQKQILVQAYSFTSAPIADALKKAHERGVTVYVLLDKSNVTGKYSGATFLFNAGVPVGIDDRHAIAHNKIILIDADTPGATVLTGSFNFTKAAEESNAENLLILKECPELATSYVANWKAHADHSHPFTGK
jgi:phosphatidylserine/phosphatidylglycerophosphate/cardiolipin synthase-like enzyme